MKFIVDAQLPQRICSPLAKSNHDSRHTLDLPSGNSSTDDEVCRIADEDGAIVITKDGDFVLSHLHVGRTRKFLLVSTGNVSNDELLRILEANIAEIAVLFQTNTFIELSRTVIVVHG